MTAALERRLRQHQSRLAVRAWEYRQRHHVAKIIWIKNAAMWRIKHDRNIKIVLRDRRQNNDSTKWRLGHDESLCWDAWIAQDGSNQKIILDHSNDKLKIGVTIFLAIAVVRLYNVASRAGNAGGNGNRWADSTGMVSRQ